MERCHGVVNFLVRSFGTKHHMEHRLPMEGVDITTDGDAIQTDAHTEGELVVEVFFFVRIVA